ncbi:MAG: hypothetical protein RR162_06345, partial [Oscillospiraceae bacterium]
MSIQMPLCPQCQQHQKRANTLSLIALLVPIGVVLFLLLPIAVIAKDLGHGSIGFLAVVFAAAFFMLSVALRLPTLGVEHSATQKSVWIGGMGIVKRMTTFSFTNGEYAQLFAAANSTQKTQGGGTATPATIEKSSYRNRARSNFLIKAVDNPYKVYVLSAALVCLALFASNRFAPPSPKTNKVISPAPTVSATATPTPAPTPTPQKVIPYKTLSPEDTQRASGAIPYKTLPPDNQIKQHELESLSTSMSEIQGKMDKLKAELDTISQKMKNNVDRYKETGDEAYYNEYYNLDSEYEYVDRQYENLRKEYNELTEKYNALANS